MAEGAAGGHDPGVSAVVHRARERRPRSLERERERERRRWRGALGLALVLPALVTASGAWRLEAWREGPPPDRVGACGFGPTCRDAGCHASYPIGSSTLDWDLTVAGPTPAPLPSLYVPGRAYELVLSVIDSDPLTGAVGFELAPIAGCPFESRGGDVIPRDPNRVRRFEGGASDVVYLSHACTCPLETSDCCGYVSEDAPGTGVNAWDFTWLAPERGTGEVAFAIALNASNWDRTPDQDRIVLGELFVGEEPCPPRIEDLEVALAPCDASGEDRVELTWGDTGTAPVAIREGEPADLGTDPDTWAAVATGCIVRDARPLVFYTVAEECELGSEGVH